MEAALLDEALEALHEDHDFLLKGDVFTHDAIETWIEYKRENEVDPIRLRPHPHEFELYGRGVILAPPQACTCFFQPRCTNESFCLETLQPEAVVRAVRGLLDGS